jgi:methylmalonyl-CoA/ethylmalonyl-CoA epimerase
MTRPLRFHHLGLAVRDQGRALRFLHTLGYHAGESVRDDAQNVNLVLCTAPGMPTIEVVSRTSEPGPLHAILERTDAQIYHVCYETDDLPETLKCLRDAGHKPYCVVPPTPAVLFGGRRVSFFVLRGFGIIEILEADPPQQAQSK